MKLLLIAGLVLIATTVNVSGFRFFDPWWAPRPCPNNTEPAPGWPWFLPGRPCIPVVVGPPPGGNGTNSNNSTDDGGSGNNGNAGGNSTDGGNASGNGTAASDGSSAGNSSNTR